MLTSPPDLKFMEIVEYAIREQVCDIKDGIRHCYQEGESPVHMLLDHFEECSYSGQDKQLEQEA